jgi:hypothetical protein
MFWYNAISLYWISDSCACKSCSTLSTQSSIVTSILSLESTYFISNFSPCLRMVIDFDLILLPHMTKSHGNLSSCHCLGEHKACVEFKQESHAQLSLTIELCFLVLCFDLRVASLLILNLVTTFVCYPSIVLCSFYIPKFVSHEVSHW